MCIKNLYKKLKLQYGVSILPITFAIFRFFHTQYMLKQQSLSTHFQSFLSIQVVFILLIPYQNRYVRPYQPFLMKTVCPLSQQSDILCC